MIPSLSDFGTHDKSLYPHLWDRCFFAFAPGLGNSSNKAIDWATGTASVFTNFSAARWGYDSGIPYLEGGANDSTNTRARFNWQSSNNPISLAAWVYWTGQATNAMPLTVGGTDAYLRITTGTSIPDFTVNNGNGRATGVTAAAVNGWTHLCGVRDSSELRLYVNGVLDKTTAYSAGAVGTGTVIGVYSLQDATASNYFAGRVDDACAWSRPLSSDEIRLLASQRNVLFVPRRRTAMRVGAPMLDQNVLVPVADLTASAVLPTYHITTPVPVADLTASVVLPTYHLTVPVPVAEAEATAILPTASATYVVTVPVAEATATAIVPGASATYTVTVPVADLTASAIMPTVSATYTMTVPVATAAATAEVPDLVTTGVTIATMPVAELLAEAIAPKTNVTIPVPVATAAATAVTPATGGQVAVVVPVATVVCSAVYEIAGNHILDELGHDTDDEDGLPLEDENTAAPNEIVVTVPVAICNCIAIPGQTVAGLETDFYADYEAWSATADARVSLTANYQTPTYSSWVRRVDTPSRGVQLK